MNDSDIAIIGMSCRFPGAKDVDEFWEMISKGKNLFIGIPEEISTQFDFSQLKNPKGAFLEKPFHFDNTFFKISYDEAVAMDPQQRIMLELAIETKENAFIHDFNDKNIGVFIGANQRAYSENITTAMYKKQLIDKVKELDSVGKIAPEVKKELLDELKNIEQSLPIDSSTITGNISNMIASRISHEFNLTGPSLTIDTACSSSLVAVHLACESLKNRECNMVYAGGVNLNLTPGIFLLMEAAQVISKTGKCVPFSEKSDGIILGEGAGLVLLKRLEDAIKDENHILSVIKGSGMNNDGHSLGIMTPSWKGQLSLLQSVYSKCGYDPAKISLIEAHGTSTPIGDSIEITVLQRFFSNQKNNLSIGSVKSNIGHLLGASGIAGLIKAVLAIKNKKLPPSIFDGQVNPKWNLKESGFKIQDSLEDWENGQIRAAGVSSFGFGGTNAHIILEEPEIAISSSGNVPMQKTQFSRNKFTYDIFPGLKPKTDSLYSIHFDEVVFEKSESVLNPDSWLLFCSEEKIHIKEKLRKSGIECVAVLYGNVYSRLDEDTYTINSSDENHLRWFMESLDKTKSYGIIYVPEAMKNDYSDEPVKQLLFIKRLIKSATQLLSEPIIWCITSGGFKVGMHEKSQPAQRALAIAFSAAMNENAGLKGGLIDIETNINSENDIEPILKLIRQSYNHPIIVRNSRFYLPALSTSAKIEQQEKKAEIRNKGVYLIIGGSSGVGEELALHLAQKFDSKIVIIGTRAVEKLSEQLKSHLDNRFEYFQTSTTEKADLQFLIENIIQKYGELNGIIFSAGIINYGSFISMNESDFEKTVAVKIKGVNILYEIIKDYNIDFVYLMSSVSALSPSWASGMSGYAAANAYLDAFAERFNSKSTLWISGSWSIWEETGMSENMNLPAGNSMIPIKLQTALQLFERSLNSGQTHTVAIHPLDTEKFSPFWVERKRKEQNTRAAQPVEIITKPTDNQIADYKSVLIKLISEAAGIRESDIDEEESFSNLGLDSISALDIVGELEEKYKLSLNPTLLYEYDSISRLSEFISNLKPDEKQGSFPLLPTQKAFYSNQVFYPESPCNSLVKVSFENLLDFSVLQKSWDILSKRHESLRLTFEMTDKGPEQKVSEISAVEIQFLKIENKGNAEKTIREIENKMVHKIYQLDKSPLYDLYFINIENSTSVLILNAHHIITDAWSMTILLKELVGIYTEIYLGNSVPENESAPLFSNYVLEHHSKKLNQTNDESGKYWLNELKDFNPVKISRKIKMSCETSSEIGVYQDVLDSEKTLAIENKANYGHVSLFQVLVSAYYKTLQKITGQSDLVIRLATANRDRSFNDIQGLTGCLADSIPLRIQIGENESLIEISKRIKGKLLQSRKFNPISSIEYAAILNSRSQNGPAGITPFGMSYLNVDYFSRNQTTKYPSIETRAALPFTDLSLICLKQNGKLLISWNFSTTCFSIEEIKELNRVYVQFVLDGNREEYFSGRDIEIEILEMPIKAFFPNLTLLHEKVFAACDFFNNKIAIHENGNNITYAELKANSIQLANAIIRAENVKKEVIGILDYPGANSTTGILAILSSGNAYVPLDPDWPAGRIENIVTHSGIEILLTSSIHLAKLFENKTVINQLKNIILLNKKEIEIPATFRVKLLSFQQESNKKLLPLSKISSSESLAYIMYTSGTTGIPKGVMVNHRAVEVFLNWISEEFNIGSEDKFIQTSSLGFGGSIRQIFSTLLAGGEIHPINRFDFKDPKSLLHFINENKISILNTVPSVLNNICEYVEQLNPEEKIPQIKKLRLLLIGGEILPAKLVERWKSHFGNFQDIINLYGSTETLVNATFHKVKNDFDYLEGIPVGKPRKGSHILLLNENGNHVKPGEKGELFVGGPSIAIGYYQAASLSKEKFVSPKANGAEGMYYRTGDLAKKDQNGEYHFLGRNDNQIQLYGNRVEPEEIEAVLSSSELLNTAAVLDFQDENRHWLIAFVVLKESQNNNVEIEIRNFVAQKLPAYMVPQKIEFLNKIPLTHAGKIDRLSLKRNYGNTFKQSQIRINQTNTESIIKTIWEKVLKIEITDVNHDFFSLGGDSILALEVLHNLRKEFKNTPKPIELFRKKTIKNLAESIDELNENQILAKDINDSEQLTNSVEEQTQFPLSYTQKGFFILNKLNPESSPNLVALIPVQGKIDKQAFQKALNFLVERHPMLRTRFIKKGLNTIQEITPLNKVKIEYRNLSQNSDSNQEIQRLFELYKKLNFDLSEPPLYRITSFLVSENSSVFLFCIHHIIGDAWSMKVLTDELLEVYDQLVTGRNVALPKLKSSFLNLVNEEAQKNNLSRLQVTNRNNFWKKSFSDLPKDELDNKWFVNDGNKGKVTLVLTLSEKEKIKAFCSDKGISLFQLFFTIYAKSLQKILNVNRLLLNTSVSGRDLTIPDIEKIIGCFARSLPVSVKFENNDLFSNVKELQESFLNSSENQEIPPNELIKIFMESGAESMQSLYRFFISYMDFSSLSTYESKQLEFKWDDADFFFNAGSVESELFIGIRISENILINFNGRTNSFFKNEVKNKMLADLTSLIKPETENQAEKLFTPKTIDSALIAYFPSLGSMSELLPLGKLSNKLAKEFIHKILPNNEPQLLEIETTPFGRTGVIFIPYFADELLTISQEKLMSTILKAVNICNENGAKYISLAGNLPSKTNYGFSVTDALAKAKISHEQPVITTGHSCTVVAVVKTIEKVLREMELEIGTLSVAIAGFGSIGQASLNLLLSKVGIPVEIIIADLASQIPGLKKSLETLHERFPNRIKVISVEKDVPDEFYETDLIIGASSHGKILDVLKFRRGTILVDDSFPHIVDTKKATERMKNEQDVLIIGAGKLDVGKKERHMFKTRLPKSWIEKSIENFGDEGLPGCQIESLLMSFDNTLPVTIGLVTEKNAAQYWSKINELNLGAVGFHLQGFQIDNLLIEKIKNIHKKRYDDRNGE